jgi:O-methyltransferase involved in polyketide biosynthesis
VADVDPPVPSIARVYDYLLSGTDNFAVDREVAGKLLTAAPTAAEVMRENRQFLSRAARWAAGRGLTQFVDLGCGMPTEPNTDSSARSVSAGARVAFVDNDAVVLARLRDLASGRPGVTVVEGDVRDTAAILAAVSAGIDLTRPACLLMGALLHFFTAPAARDLVAAYVAALAPGSYLVLSVGRADGDEASRGFGAYSSGHVRAYNHSVADFTGFFGSLALVEPGIVDARRWHPEPELTGPLPPRAGQSLVGVARVGSARVGSARVG